MTGRNLIKKLNKLNRILIESLI